LLKLNSFIFYLIIFEKPCNTPLLNYSDYLYLYYVVGERGVTREEMGLEPFVDTEIRSSIMGVPVFINQEIIAYVIGRASEGNFKDGLDNNKKSPWNEVVNETMFNIKKKG